MGTPEERSGCAAPAACSCSLARRGWWSRRRADWGRCEMKQILITNHLGGHRGLLNRMKTCHLLFCGFAGILASGCSLKMASPPEATANVPPLTESTELTVPLPAQTPFDGNPKARAAYLEYYAMGYRLAGADYASPGCLCTSEGDAERYEACLLYTSPSPRDRTRSRMPS